MKPINLLLFIIILSGCSQESWKTQIIEGTGIQYEVPESFLTTTKKKGREGYLWLYDTKARSDNGDYIRITVLKFPETPEADEHPLPLKCPALLSEKVEEKIGRQFIAGNTEMVLGCKTNKEVTYIAVLTRDNKLITVTASSRLERGDLSKKLLTKLEYKPNA